jgi:hypothetical protein
VVEVAADGVGGQHADRCVGERAGAILQVIEGEGADERTERCCLLASVGIGRMGAAVR